jgi:hypothetical protein
VLHFLYVVVVMKEEVLSCQRSVQLASRRASVSAILTLRVVCRKNKKSVT